MDIADIDTFIRCVFWLPWQRRSEKRLLRMSDKCSFGGIIWPRTVFSCLVLFVRTKTERISNFDETWEGNYYHASKDELITFWEKLDARTGEQDTGHDGKL